MNSRFDILDTPLHGLKLIQRNPIGDHRGYLERMFCGEELQPLIPGRGIGIVQINHTLTSKRGTVRGLHFQYPPHAETKIVSCLRGEVFDVAVDLRQGSPTFLHWHAEILSANNHRTLLIPEGFAHGFQTLIEDCELLYFHTAAYQPGAEGGLNVEDPRLDIRWPEAMIELSSRDAAHPPVTAAFVGVVV
jgi:dTDP-4-dehydrorhamnose 3,5-epimerase